MTSQMNKYVWIFIVLVLLGCKPVEPRPYTYRLGQKIVLKTGKPAVVHDVHRYSDGDQYYVTYQDHQGKLHQIHVYEYETERSNE